MRKLSILLSFAICLFMASDAFASKTFKKGLKDFKKGRYEKAAARFWQVQQSTEENSEEYEASFYFIGQSLHNLGLFYAASEYFYSVVKQAGNTEFISKALESIQETVEKRPYERALLMDDLIYSIELGFLPPDVNDFVHFHQGRINKVHEHDRWAKFHFDKIRSDSYYGMRVKYLNAVEYLKKNKLKKAVAILEEIINGEFDDVDVKNRARQTIARLHYEKKEFKDAMARYETIDSPLYKQATVFLEKGWTHYFLENFEKSLGSLLALKAPMYSGFYDAEKFIIRVLIYKRLCGFDAARGVLGEYHKEYDRAVRMIKEREDLTKNKRLMGALFWAAAIKQRYDFLQTLKPERDRLKKMGKFKKGFLKHLKKIYDLKTKELEQTLKNDLLDGLELVSEQVLDTDEQVNLLNYELRLDELKRVKMFQAVKLEEEEKIPLTHGDTIYWPFDGEYWLDEMPDYKYLLQDRCKAEVFR